MLKTSTFALALLVLTVLPATAAEPVVTECGVPPPAQLDTGSIPYCNIHDRRFGYKDEADKFRKLLDERRANYIAPGQKAMNQFKDDLKARHDAYEPPKPAGEPAKSADELAGPPIPSDGFNP